MDASHLVVAFLLFTAFQGGEQLPVVDDTAEFFDVFPGGESTEEIPMNISNAGEMSASYKSAVASSQPADMPHSLLDGDYSLPPPGYNSTPTSEELEFLQNTTQIPSNITSQYEETGGTRHSSEVLYIVIAIFVTTVICFAYWILSKYFDGDTARNPQFPRSFQSIQYLDTYRGTTFG